MSLSDRAKLFTWSYLIPALGGIGLLAGAAVLGATLGCSTAAPPPGSEPTPHRSTECACVCDGTSSSGGDMSTGDSSSTGMPPDVGPDPDSSSGGPEAWPSSEGTHTLADGRRYRIRYPEPWDGVTPVRPLFAFHACSSSGLNTGQWDSYHYSQNGGFMVILPEAASVTFPGSTNGTCWRTDPAGVDMPFVEDLIAEVESWPTIDATERHLTGWSGGAFMSNSVACNLGADHLLAGSGGMRYIIDGNTLGDMPTSCVGSTEVYLHHGRQDQRVPVSVGQEAVDLWASEMGCTAPVSTVAPLDWCGQPSVACEPGDGCVEYACTTGTLTWCQDASGDPPWYHTQVTGQAQRDVGELLFND